MKHLLTPVEKKDLEELFGSEIDSICKKLNSSQRVGLEDLVTEPFVAEIKGEKMPENLAVYFSNKALQYKECKEYNEVQKLEEKINSKKALLEKTLDKNEIARLEKEIEVMTDSSQKLTIDWIKTGKDRQFADSQNLRHYLEIRYAEIGLALLEMTGQNKEYDVNADDSFLMAIFWLFYGYKPNNMPTFLVLANQQVKN